MEVSIFYCLLYIGSVTYYKSESIGKKTIEKKAN